jgi:tetratricopeptide (TPR) repeat protein
MRRQSLLCLLACSFTCAPSFARPIPTAVQMQAPPAEQVQIAPPAQRVEPPSPTASSEELENRGDELRAEKNYLDALDYYRAALAKKPNNPQIYNKAGIAELMDLHYREAGRFFERALRGDHSYADAYNNLGVIQYEAKKYSQAIKRYKQAIQLQADSASFFSNLGAAYFARKDFAEAVTAYAQALQLDPGVFDRTSHSGVSAQLASPEDRAHYDYVLAKLYAKIGSAERSLEYLKKAMEEGYKNVNDVFKDPEFAVLRKDSRFTELMAAKPQAISE